MSHALTFSSVEDKFEIIRNNEVSEQMNIIFTAELDTLTKIKKQLEQHCNIFLASGLKSNVTPSVNLEDTPFKIVKTVAVTVSGHSKYSISPDISPDPYEDVELSDDDYLPSGAASSTSCSSLEINAEGLQNVIPKHRGTVKRRLFNESNQPKNVSSLSALDGPFNFEIPNQPQSVQPSKAVDSPSCCQASISSSQTCGSETLAEVTLNVARDVMVSILQPIHHGTYEVALFTAFDAAANISNKLRGYIVKRNLAEEHHCKPLVPGHTDVCYTIRRVKTSIQLVLEVCCPQGALFGKERTLQNQGQEVAFLKYTPPDVIDEFDYTPTKGTKLKQHFCLFCQRLKTCMTRHLEIVHSNESKVKSVLKLSPISKRKGLRKLRYEGDKLYNLTVSPNSRITSRKTLVTLISTNIHCPHCNGLFSRKSFSRHERRCSNRPADYKKRLYEFQEFERNERLSDDVIFNKIFERMKEDEIGEIARKDDTIKMLALDLLSNDVKEQKLKTVRSQMRRCARLFIAMRNLDSSVKCFRDCFKPDKYKQLTWSIRNVCSNNAEEGLCHFNLALQYGPLLSRLARRIEIEFLRQDIPETDEQIVRIRNFQKLHSADFKCAITRSALSGIKEKRKKHVVIPKTGDIEKLTKYLKKEGDLNYEKLGQEGFSFSSWRNLGKSLLCQILVFNRRRVGEISRVLMVDYYGKKNIDDEDRKHMTRLQIVLADYYKIMNIMAKRGRVVPVMLKPYIVEQLDLFIEMRTLAGVDSNNKYLFGYPNADGHLDASVVLREYSRQCNADFPTSLRSTKLRQQVATMTQLLNLNQNELHQLSDFMGHDFSVHLKHYRMNEINSQVTRWARFFSAVGRTDVFKHKNKTLDELETYVSNDEAANENDTDNEGEEEVAQTSGEQEIHLEDIGNELLDSPPRPRRAAVSKRPTPRKSPSSTQLLAKLRDPTEHIRTRKSALRRRWTNEEQKLMRDVFKEELLHKRNPKLHKCEKIYEQYETIFNGRRPLSLYMWVQNENRRTS